MRILVAGNPNSGKSTLFNALTGVHVKVANYPGITVERKTARLKLPGGNSAEVVDLPGCYSLISRSPEEEIAMLEIVSATPEEIQCIVAVVDGAQIARGLYFVLQLLTLNIPVIVALNRMDVLQNEGISIDAPTLANRLGVPVVPISARTGFGLQKLLSDCEELLQKQNRRSEKKWLVLDEKHQNATQELLRQHALPSSPGFCEWLLLSDSSLVQRHLKTPEISSELNKIRHDLQTTHTQDFSQELIEKRYALVDNILKGVHQNTLRPSTTKTETLDRVLLHPIWGTGIFVLVMLVLFQLVFTWAQPLIDVVDNAVGLAGQTVEHWIPISMTRSLVVHGLLAGVGNVLVFVPQIALLFFALGLLEESGYLARASFLTERFLAHVGLAGRSFAPLLSSFACAVPGIMSTRAMSGRRDRLLTMLVAPFMSCSARLPVYALVVSAVFNTRPKIFGFLSPGALIVTAMYLLGIVAALLTAWLLNRTFLHGPATPFVLEMPTYQMPALRPLLFSVYERCRVFVTQTGVIIVLLSLVIWGLMSFPNDGLTATEIQAEQKKITTTIDDPAQQTVALEQLERRNQAQRLEQSWGGQLGKWIEPVIAPLGFDWRIGVGLIAAFAAREVLVSTLGQIYALGSEVEPDSPALRDALLADRDTSGRPRFNPAVALSLMVFFVLALQCMSTFATVRRETGGWKWPLFQLAYMTALAYGGSFVTYRIAVATGLGT